jgi:hypothetical protein
MSLNYCFVRNVQLAKPTSVFIYKYFKCWKKRSNPTLTIQGFIIHCTNTITNAIEHKFDWENALVDATITSGVTFFGTLGGSAVAGLDGVPGLKAAIIAAFAQFFIFLALKRGIVQPKETSL